MGATVSYNSYDISGEAIVPVIASFDASGNIIPLYVRINGESFRILSSTLVCSLGLISFNCQVENYGVAKPLTLTYHPRESVWTMKSPS